MNTFQLALTIVSSSIVTFALSIAGFKYNLIKIKANSSSEVSKSEQDKITTADMTIELVNKLRDSMDKEFEDMKQKIQDLEKLVRHYQEKCDKCEFNKN